MMDPESSLETPSVSQGSIKRCFNKPKTTRPFLCYLNPLFRLFLEGFCFLSVT